MDTGCTEHYAGTNVISTVTKTKNGVLVGLPNGEKMQSAHIAYLPINILPKPARKAHIFPAMGTKTLLSIGQLCDNGCYSIFTQTHVFIIHKEMNEILLTGNRENSGGKMWKVNFTRNATINNNNKSQT